MGQLEVGYASAMLDVLGEVVRAGDEDGAPFPLAEAVANGAAQTAASAPRGVSVTPPEPLETPCVFGWRRQMEQAVADLTFHALTSAQPETSVTWQVGNGAGEATVSLRFKGDLGDTRPEQLFAMTRDALGQSRGLGLLLARWTVECHGGEITAEQAGDEVRFVARMPLSRQEVPS